MTPNDLAVEVLTTAVFLVRLLVVALVLMYIMFVGMGIYAYRLRRRLTEMRRLTEIQKTSPSQHVQNANQTERKAQSR